MYLYRYVDDYLDNRIHEEVYKVIKPTPSGYWIRKLSFTFGGQIAINENGEEIFYTKKKWIGRGTARNRRFAFESKEDAMRNYRFRKKAQIRILEERLEIANILYEQAIKEDVTYHPDEEKENWSRRIHWQRKDLKKQKQGYEFIKEEEFSV